MPAARLQTCREQLYLLRKIDPDGPVIARL